MKQIPNDLLVEKTVEFMLFNDLHDLPNEFSNSENEPWAKICQLCLKTRDEFAIKNIHSNWKRNSFNFRNLVIERLSNQNVDLSEITKSSSESSDEDSGVQRKIFHISNIKFKTYISGICRKVIRQSFNEKLSTLLNKEGINCFVKSKPIYLTTSNRYENYFANGTFVCILKKQCGLKFDVQFFKEPSQNTIKIVVTWIGSCKHRMLSKEPKRISGKKRKLLAYRLFTYGTNRLRSESVIFASKTPKKGEFKYYNEYFKNIFQFLSQ